MTQQEIYEPWSPLPNLRGEFELQTLVDSEDGLQVTLTNDTGRKVGIDFRSVLAYRLTGRAVFPKSWLREPALNGEHGAFHLVRHSTWIGLLSEEQMSQLQHFAFVLSGEVIEVLSDEQPNVQWRNSLFGDAV